MSRNPNEGKPLAAKSNSIEIATDSAVTWRHIAPMGVTVEDCESPDYWMNVLREIGQQRLPGKHAWNKIEILAEDGSWEAVLRVTSIEGPRAFTRRLFYWADGADQATASKPKAAKTGAIPDGYTVEFVEQNGWRARDPSGNVVTEKKPTKADAIRACIEHLKPKAA